MTNDPATINSRPCAWALFAALAPMAAVLAWAGCGVSLAAMPQNVGQDAEADGSPPTPDGGAAADANVDAKADALRVGAWVKPVSGGGPTTIDDLEAAIGRKLDYSLHYESLADAFPNAAETSDAANGRTPMLSVGCGVAADVASGKLDAEIDARAAAYAAFGNPILLRYCWEMNLAMRGVATSDFIAAWKRMHDRTIAKGAKNVLWYFCPSHGGGATYYPGDAFVDYAGWDAYDDRGAGLEATMLAPYMAYASIDKPFIVGETGAMASLNQATYLDGSSRALLAQKFPKIVGITYFDANGAIDWSFSPAGLSAFKAFANSH